MPIKSEATVDNPPDVAEALYEIARALSRIARCLEENSGVPEEEE